ncbi:BON domain-containing protein [Pararhizobium sp. O133]|uniref:BON domain-containing protein n=1 Tax=Pararhizobium sp. O133 TaxID=3449278 RepID=UPI003F6871C6
MDDLNLRARVLETLECLPLITPSEIGVAVHQGVVVLTGHVSEASHKGMIEFAVLNLPDVRGLAQKIHIAADLEFLDTDEEIARRMLRMVEWNLQMKGRDVRVRVEGRWVTLTGHVGCSDDFERAEQFARMVRGCAGFDNHLVVSSSRRADAGALESAG